MKEKKQWHKPALIVLLRHKPEEAVLRVCKYDSQQHGYGCSEPACGGSDPVPS